MFLGFSLPSSWWIVSDLGSSGVYYAFSFLFYTLWSSYAGGDSSASSISLLCFFYTKKDPMKKQSPLDKKVMLVALKILLEISYLK